MKKIAIALMVAGICAAPSLASAVEPYVSLSAGMGFMNNSNVDLESGQEWSTANHDIEYNSGYALEGAIGMKNDMFRGEIAIGYQAHDIYKVAGIKADSGDVSILSFMANVYADFKMEEGITPYLMGGMGVATIDGSARASSTTYIIGEPARVSSASYSLNETPFAWQLGLGVGVHATDNIIVDLGYRYFATADINVNSTDYDKLNISTNKVMLGMRYSF